MSNIPVHVIAVLGPTAVGKTSFIESCTDLPLEIITADAMQVYRLMDVGTAKPSDTLRRQFPHHLLDICYPDEQFSVGDFVESADQLIQEIHERGNIPVIVGGSGFYLWNFLYGLPQTPKISSEIRTQVKQLFATQSRKEVWQQLQAVDPVSAKRIAPNDRYRVARALEVYLESGMPLSDFPVATTPRDRHAVMFIGLRRDKEELRQRIVRRCEMMFRNGLQEEVEMLMDRGYAIDDPGIRAIGYREFWEYRTEHGELPKDASAVQAGIVNHSLAYVKRQYTYFSRIPQVKWYEADRHIEIKEAMSAYVDV